MSHSQTIISLATTVASTKTPSILREYDVITRDQLDKGIIEPVVETVPTLGQVHYLPHHAIIHADKSTTKVRIVYDASAKLNGPSLNV